MFKINPIIIFTLNLLLMVLSWTFYKFPQGDEYLILFAIPLLFIVAPFVLKLSLTITLISMNFIFLVFYKIVGALNGIDVFVLTFLFSLVTAGGYLVKVLYVSFSSYYKRDVLSKRTDYNNIVLELEAIDRRGRKTENELSRISRLYEITKKLAPALKIEELMDALFEFLEENFKFTTAHLLAFDEEKFSQVMSKSVEKGEEEKDKVLNYEKLIKYMRDNNYDSVFMEKEIHGDILKAINVEDDTFMVFPLFIAGKLCAMLAIEGASNFSYKRFSILISQIALEFRKVQLYEEVERLSIIDGLTEVYLRRYLMDRLAEEVERAERLKLKFSIAMVDVDNFKECNDKHGHLVGDSVLKKIAERLKFSVREVDLIARYGGEEFCVVLPETTKKLAMTVAERLRKSIEEESIRAFDEELKITISVGVATYPEDGENVEIMIDKSDGALYKAKRKGKNMVCTT
jgi:diguanylate cyclase (GGDEF)-like protein